MYMTVAEEMLTVAPEYAPCGTFMSEIGCIVPIKCIISTGVAEDTTDTEPPLVFVSIMEAMVMLTAVSRSDGASPIFTCRELVAGGGFCELDVLPPPHADKKSRDAPRVAAVTSCTRQW
jgi:hypothetical protein